jgi:hypothetical protein
MTQADAHIPQQHSLATDVVISVLTGAMILIAGFLSLSQFAII